MYITKKAGFLPLKTNTTESGYVSLIYAIQFRGCFANNYNTVLKNENIFVILGKLRRK